jgi:hypothetical protein
LSFVGNVVENCPIAVELASISLLIELIDSSSSTTAFAICLSISFINVSDLTPLAFAVCKNCKSLA